jgi:hypothetical protein
MNSISLTEYLGYVASIVIMISFMMKNVITLRFINVIGGLLFIVYGVLLSMSIPIIATNTFVVGVNVYYLIKHYRKH